jgi:hypothetical protein
MGIEHALDIGPDRVITDLAAEPPQVQDLFQRLFARSGDALRDEDETAETFFRTSSDC